MSRSYEIEERPANLGGGWVLIMFLDGDEMGRGYYPLFLHDRPLGVDEVESVTESVTKALFAEAQADGDSWVSLSTD